MMVAAKHVSPHVLNSIPVLSLYIVTQVTLLSSWTSEPVLCHFFVYTSNRKLSNMNQILPVPWGFLYIEL